MKYEVDKFIYLKNTVVDPDTGNKVAGEGYSGKIRVGIKATLNDTQSYIIDREVDKVEGKTEEEYVAEVYADCQSEIDTWADEMSLKAKEFNPETGKLIG